jgi:thioredoxin reductase (NADPH)
MTDQIEHVKCLIIGSGPAGYTAAIYAARAGLNPVMYEGLQPGGQLTITTEVDNFPGYPKGVTGPAMMEDLKAQSVRFDTDVRMGMVTSADFNGTKHTLVVDEKTTITADSVIISTGASAKWLGIPSEEKFNGFGVSACAVCDGFFYKNQDVAVVGAGDTAAEEATYLAKICKKVYMVVRRDEMRASKAMQQRVLETKNIEVIFDSTTKEIVGDDSGVNGAIIINKKGEERKLDVTGFFVAIGHTPNTDIFKEFITLDSCGYIETIPGSSKTNIKGVFAVGDVQDTIYRQAVTAAGSGCMGALDAERYLTEEGLA